MNVDALPKPTTAVDNGRWLRKGGGQELLEPAAGSRCCVLATTYSPLPLRRCLSRRRCVLPIVPRIGEPHDREDDDEDGDGAEDQAREGRRLVTGVWSAHGRGRGERRCASGDAHLRHDVVLLDLL